MRNVLGNLNSALGTATSTLRQLSIEQEHRARAEEARTLAERSAREAQKFEALGRLAGGVAHDFNNALCVMKCWSSYLLEVSTDEEVRNAMLEIKRSTENAEHLTQHLLAFSRSEKGKLEVSDLAEVVSHECRTLRRLLPKNIVVTEQVEGPIHVPLGKGQM
jgi:signal transduction histidine kinase